MAIAPHPVFGSRARESTMSQEQAATTDQQQSEEPKSPKKKLRGQVRIIRERCKGCGYCVAFCPAGALEMSSEFNEKGYHYPQLVSGADCTGCDLCGMYCPDFAITGARVPVESDEQPSQKKEQGVQQRVRRQKRDPNRRALP
jgi:2-oxoglutarate ferredoxin oxidoreductase subunit delta